MFDKKVDDYSFLCVKNSYPGMFTQYLNARKGRNHPHHYYDSDMSLNTFKTGKMEKGAIELIGIPELEKPFNVLQGAVVLKT